MDKLIYDDNGKTTISNDGATIMNLLDIGKLLLFCRGPALSASARSIAWFSSPPR